MKINPDTKPAGWSQPPSARPTTRESVRSLRGVAPVATTQGEQSSPGPLSDLTRYRETVHANPHAFRVRTERRAPPSAFRHRTAPGDVPAMAIAD